MGYYTTLWGQFNVEPPLNADELSFLNDFSEVRHMDRDLGPLYVRDKTSGFGSSEYGVDVRDHNKPPADQPSLWCPWGFSVTTIEPPEEAGKHYGAEEWLAYFVKYLLSAEARDYIDEHMMNDPRLSSFTCDHVVNGLVDGQGEEPEDRWKVEIVDNKVLYYESELAWKEPKEMV